MSEHTDILPGFLFSGEAKTVRFGPIEDPDGVAADPNGWLVRFAVKAGPDEAERLLEVDGTVAGGGTFTRVVDGLAFYVDLSLEQADTEAVPAGEWLWAFARIDAGEETNLAEGAVTFGASAALP